MGLRRRKILGFPARRGCGIIQKRGWQTIAAKTVTYDFERLMTGAAKVKTSDFAGAMVGPMG